MKKCIVYFVPDYDESNYEHSQLSKHIYYLKGFSSLHTEGVTNMNWMMRHINYYFEKNSENKSEIIEKIIQEIMKLK